MRFECATPCDIRVRCCLSRHSSTQQRSRWLIACAERHHMHLWAKAATCMARVASMLACRCARMVALRAAHISRLCIPAPRLRLR